MVCPAKVILIIPIHILKKVKVKENDFKNPILQREFKN